MNSAQQWQPTTPTERYKNVDIIRGLALFGVLIINLLSDFRVLLLEHIGQPYPNDGRLDHWVDLVTAGFLEFKALTIFSFLFGIGIAIQADKAPDGSVRPKTFLVRRLFGLFLLGTAHLFLIWNGDILTLYAVCGLLLIPSVRLPWQALAFIGAVMILLQELISFDLNLPTGAAASLAILQAREIYGGGGFFAILQFRWQEAWSLILPILVSVLPRTVGLMCLGMAAWRSGVVREPERHRGKLVTAVVIGLSIGGPITVNEIWARSTGHSFWTALQIPHVDASILLALGYFVGLLLWLTPRRASRLPRLAAMGQMALTNYLVQSVVLGFVFYGYGFGLLGRVRSAAAVCLGVTLYLAQLEVSRRWLQRFRFGPLEWLWRSFAYGRQQPMLSTLLIERSGLDAKTSRLLCSLLLLAGTALRAASDPEISGAAPSYSASTLSISGTTLLGYHGSGVFSVSLPNKKLTVQSDSPTSVVGRFPVQPNFADTIHLRRATACNQVQVSQ